MTVHVFGSINLDLVYRVPHLVAAGETLASRSLTTVLGGKGANQSVALARAGARVAHLGRIGRVDAAMLATLDQAGVDTAGVERVEQVSGHAIIQVDDAGENAIVLHGGANRGFDRHALDARLERAVAGDWLLLQNECDGLEHAFAIAAERGLSIAFNPAPMEAGVLELPLADVDLLIVNETEAAMLSGRASVALDATSLAELDASLASICPRATRVVTLGGRGARLVVGERFGQQACALIEVAAPTVDVVDTTGAGDTFVGYLLAALVAGATPDAALRRAVTAGSLAVGVAGATPSIPLAAAVDAAERSATGASGAA